MSVIRDRTVEFQKSVGEITEAIRNLLEKGRGFGRYRYTNQEINGNVFKTTIKPFLYPLFLPTHLTIEVRPAGRNVFVTVKTSSQSFIYGDIFNFYNKYIDEFLFSLKSQFNDAA